MRFRLALFVSAVLAAFGSTSVAMALPGDRAIDSPAPGFRLDAGDLEPGCFDLGRLGFWFANVDASSFDAGDNLPDGEVVLHNLTGIGGVPSFDVDQVLVPSAFGGYQIYNTFDVGSGANENAPSISNGETGTEMLAPDANGNDNPDPVDGNDIIVCLSDDKSASQNEPYAQEDGGIVSAKNRPIIAPKVSAIGVSRIEPLNTYKVGFGYDVEKWYSAPSFDGHGLFPTVTDPNAFPSPTFGGILPAFVRMAPRPDDLAYDARRVNDVDKAGESWTRPDVDDGQDIFFSADGDDTAWTDSNGNGLLTTVTQGDLPIQWAVRPSMANPGSLRETELTLADLHAWNQEWQDFYDCKAPMPSMPIPPGANAPAPDDAMDCAPPEGGPEPAEPPAPAPVVNNNSTSTTSVTSNTTVVNRCVSARQVSLRLAKKATRGTVRVNGKTIKARRSNGRLRAMADLRGMEGSPGSYARATVRQKVGGKWQRTTRLLKLC
jgi:hypothetical protein